MKNALCLTFCLLFLIGLGACTPDQEEEEQSNPRFSLPLDSFCTAFLSVFEEQQTRCGNGHIDPVERAELSMFCEEGILGSVRAGVIVYEPRLATACLASYQQSCNPESSDVACSKAFRGTVAPGEECFFELECADGGCANGNNSCPGTCEFLAQPGGSCVDRACPEGTYCNLNSICATELGAGEPCFGGECEGGLECYCDDIPCTTVGEGLEGVCQEPPPLGEEGEACSYDRACRDGFFCLSDVGSSHERGRGRCEVVAKPGDPCDVGGTDLNWFFNGCEGSLCGAAEGQTRGICTLSEEGGLCITSGFEFDIPTCDGDFVCGEDGRCQAYSEDNTSSEDSFCVRP